MPELSLARTGRNHNARKERVEQKRQLPLWEKFAVWASKRFAKECWGLMSLPAHIDELPCGCKRQQAKKKGELGVLKVVVNADALTCVQCTTAFSKVTVLPPQEEKPIRQVGGITQATRIAANA